MLSKQAKIKPAPVAEGGANPAAAPKGEAGPEAPKKGEASQECPKSKETGQEAPKKGKASPEAPQKGEPRQEAPKKEEARQEVPKKGEIIPETPKKGEARQEMPQEGGASQEARKKPVFPFGKVPFRPHHWQLLTLILGVCSLVFLIVLLGLIGKYLHVLEATRRKMAMLQGQTQKIKDSVKKQAGGKGSRCDSCLDTWVQRGDTCYLFSNMSAKWPECVEHCKKQGAKLVKMDSQGEMAFLKRETRKLFRVEFRYRRHYSYWIGLTYIASLKKWVWLDGSPFTLDLSSVGAQAVYEANDTCVFFIQGMSHAKDCIIKHYCLCKKNK
ncbi:C-type lectin domain family 1 member B-like [Dermochelys coriacea]|uniref:C-type lectin domain family 1 member B-like n=1 Tax=Dermochelys coriacea TaxID=27794 RepID=UPI001CAA1E87|nr:C-type lectin domain family 1 member B-like [Dermochelys coriacea]